MKKLQHFIIICDRVWEKGLMGKILQLRYDPSKNFLSLFVYIQSITLKLMFHLIPYLWVKNTLFRRYEAINTLLVQRLAVRSKNAIISKTRFQSSQCFNACNNTMEYHIMTILVSK